MFWKEFLKNVDGWSHGISRDFLGHLIIFGFYAIFMLRGLIYEVCMYFNEY